MFQRIVFCGILAAALIAVAAWAVGLLPVAAKDGAESDQAPTSGNPAPRRTAGGKIAIGGPLFAPPAPFVQHSPLPRPTGPRSPTTDPIVVTNCRLGLTNIGKVDVPSPRNVEGILTFIAVEIKPGENPPAHDLFEVQIGKERKLYRRLHEGDQVSAGQAVALVDDRLPRADFISKQAKQEAAIADAEAAIKTRDETLERYKTAQRLFGEGKGNFISYEEYRGAYATYLRYRSEAVSKQAGIKVAEAELKQSETILGMHQIRTPISGTLKTLHKHEGESIKSLDPVLQIQNYDRLRAEGRVDLQYVQDLREGMKVVIEPIVRDSPERSFPGHRDQITGVAVSKDAKNPMIVSCSEDGTARVWKRDQRQQHLVLRHPPLVAVRAVACTPPGSDGNLCLTGASDGSGRLWDLDNDSEQPLRELKAKHRSGIRCVTFSPDGKTCATGGDDRDIMIWDTASGELRYRLSGEREIPPHKDAVTALHFTPDSHLVSVSRDDTVRVWQLGEKGAEPVRTIKRRSSEIAQLGISPDGQWVLDEHGPELRILSLSKDLTEGSLQAKTGPFKTLALFSPDGQLVLTTSGSEGHLQLWHRDPVRSYELRQLIPGLRSAVTCAAFDPNGQFVVAGTQGHKVYLWRMPTEKEITRQITATITDIEKTVETVAGTVRIVAEFDNPQDRPLLAQDTVTMVAYPSK